jgi:hypothetical protein
MDDDRVSTLEQQFAKMEAREVDIQQKLELLLSHVLQKPIQPPSTSPASVPVDSTPWTDVRHTVRDGECKGTLRFRSYLRHFCS